MEYGIWMRSDLKLVKDNYDTVEYSFISPILMMSTSLSEEKLNIIQIIQSSWFEWDLNISSQWVQLISSSNALCPPKLLLSNLIFWNHK